MASGKSAGETAFLETLKQASDSYHHSLHLRGRMVVTVPKCDGCHAPGLKTPGWTDSGYGCDRDYPGEPCRKCGSVEVKASPEVELAAVMAEIRSLQARAKALRRNRSANGKQ